MIESLAATAAVHTTPEAAEWLRSHLGAIGDSFFSAFGAAGKRIGHASITRADAARITAAGLLVPVGMGADECARGALVLAAVWASPPADHVSFIRDLLHRGDARERQAVLRVFAGLPEPARFAELAVDATRSHTTSVFEAIVCDNSYPARWLADTELAAIVNRATELHIPVEKIAGIRMRTLSGS